MLTSHTQNINLNIKINISLLVAHRQSFPPDNTIKVYSYLLLVEKMNSVLPKLAWSLSDSDSNSCYPGRTW